MDSTLVQIIREYERFSELNGTDTEKDNLAKFASFLTSSLSDASDFSEEVSIENWKTFNRKTMLEMATSYIGKMGRYVDNYARKNLDATPLGSIEEFTYLVVLLEYPECTKTDLIKKNGHAVTTGTDIIKRLHAKGYVLQTPNPEDKRSFRISMTEEGKNALFASSDVLNQLSIVGAGVLSNEELVQLVGTLQKLDDFHERIHEQHKSLELSEIIEANETKLHLMNQ